MSEGRSRLTALADQVNSNSVYKLNGVVHTSTGSHQGTNTSGYVSRVPARAHAGPSRAGGVAAHRDDPDDDDIIIMDGPLALPRPRQTGTQPVFSSSNQARKRSNPDLSKPRRLSKPYFADDSKAVNAHEVPDWLEVSEGDKGGFVHRRRAGSANSGDSKGGVGNGMGMTVQRGCKADFEVKQDLEQKLAALESEMDSIAAQIEPLKQLHTQLGDERMLLLAQIDSLSSAPAQRKRKELTVHDTAGGIDYTAGGAAEGFEWSTMMKRKMKQVWGIGSFRLCQEGVCNANMDGRDILCVMPTGGGKSLTYQLPALLSPGTTIVISPLISLINDQVMHLREAGVECVMLTGATSTADQNDAFKRMSYGPSADGRNEIKLCYVTPEKVAKSKRFTAALESMSSAGRLARIVIDEAHCCSQLGHDFRPDYKKLSILKNLFPNVPILAVTATLSHKVLPDLLKILRLPPLTDGTAANGNGTVYFTAPLYRKNLHYSVVPKPSNAKAAIESMAQYITSKHPGKIGIVYCLSKKDTETVADALYAVSNGAIKTGVYHADVPDAEKQAIHRQWSKGKIHCVCATIAFGLGIDCPATEYVLHHSLSKSMDGYYQETGRAGRDGRDADCVLFYRGQDATRLSSLTLGEVGGQEKVYEMLRYAQDLKMCRKLSFAKYFATSASLPSNAWDDPDAEEGTGGVSACGHCDNCTRDPSSIQTIDVTLDAWRIVRVAAEVEAQGGRVTVSGLADLVRGLGGGQFPVVAQSGKSRGKVSAEKGVVNLQEMCEGKVLLSKEQTESLLIDMFLQDYLKEDFHPTAYSVNVYIQPGGKALRLSRQTKGDIETGHSPVSINSTFPSKNKPEKKTAVAKPAGSKRKRARGKGAEDIEEETDAQDDDAEPDADMADILAIGPSGSELSDARPPTKARKTAPKARSRQKLPTPKIDIDDIAAIQAIQAIQASESELSDAPPAKKAATRTKARPKLPRKEKTAPMFDVDSDDLEEVQVGMPVPQHKPVKTSAVERWAQEKELESDDLDGFGSEEHSGWTETFR